MDNLYGFKELTDVNFRVLQPVKFNDRNFEKGETIMSFEKINLLSDYENKLITTIAGGKGNLEQLYWTDANICILSFSQGVFSKEQLAFFSNSAMHKQPSMKVHERQYLETDENSTITLPHTHISELFVYKADTKERIDVVNEDNLLIFETPYLEVICDYNYTYSGDITTIEMGKTFYNSYLSLDAKTTIKDNRTGSLVTGIIEIPKLRIVSPLQLSMGEKSNFVSLDFQGVGTKEKNESLTRFFILGDNIHADIM